jgi:hypothetical protein
MDYSSELEQKETERAALLDQAGRIVQAAEAKSRAPGAEEDSLVLELMSKAMHLEEEIGHLKRQARRV